MPNLWRGHAAGRGADPDGDDEWPGTGRGDRRTVSVPGLWGRAFPPSLRRWSWVRASIHRGWWTARLGGAGPFRAAACLLTHFTGVAMSAATVRRITQATGATMRQLELVFTDTVRATGTVPAPPPEVPLQVSIDGRLVHLRAEGWREVKVLAIGARGPRDGLTALTYAATLGDVVTFGAEALGELGRRTPPIW